MDTQDKKFLTYNRQMKKLRNDKQIGCQGSDHKRILIRSGYFNLVNGYKEPFINGTKADGSHCYLPGTSLDQLYEVKKFDDKLRLLLLRYITQIEEEVRALTAYQFDSCNDNGQIHWYESGAYDDKYPVSFIMSAISKAYGEISKSKLDYISFYMSNHSMIPTWIMLKTVNFSTFIDVLHYSKPSVKHSLCNLYGMTDANNKPNVKLLIGSLHWLRKVRNACAHNERIYSIERKKKPNDKKAGRIKEKYISQMRSSYLSSKNSNQKLLDIIIYFKYYLPSKEFSDFISELKVMLFYLKNHIHPSAFDYVRGHMGIKDLTDLDVVVGFEKVDINYNKFDK